MYIVSTCQFSDMSYLVWFINRQTFRVAQIVFGSQSLTAGKFKSVGKSKDIFKVDEMFPFISLFNQNDRKISFINTMPIVLCIL